MDVLYKHAVVRAEACRKQVFFLLMKMLWSVLADYDDVNGAADVSLGVQQQIYMYINMCKYR